MAPECRRGRKHLKGQTDLPDHAESAEMGCWTIGRGNQVESGAFKPSCLSGEKAGLWLVHSKIQSFKDLSFLSNWVRPGLQGTPTKNTGCTIERLPVCQSSGEYKDTGSGSPQLSFLTSSSTTEVKPPPAYTKSHPSQYVGHPDSQLGRLPRVRVGLRSSVDDDEPHTNDCPANARSFFPAQFIPGQLSGGEHTAGTISAGAGPASASCGLESNVWGQVSPVSSSGYANLCLQCRVNVFGVDVFEFNFYSALAASISAHGVSASQCSVLQSAIEGDLLRLAAGSKTSASCTAACKADERCDSCSFDNGVCQIKAVDYVKQNHAGAPLAQAFQGLYSNGGSGYCSICPAEDSLINEKCPAGLSACPISSGMTAKPSAGFECLDLQQEVTSCGGCASTGQGVDCTTMKGVSSAGCSEGKCKICKALSSIHPIYLFPDSLPIPPVSCKYGYRYSTVHNVCYKSHRSSKFNSTSH
ncbi:hypothetical protein H4Q26_004402 [Puccinia striiformis f. sp. tritici PST-130]|nr:hypothetical protein H4Q26_004402 [Puccinia striiformis f. sp. tritici PST-130]